MIKDIKTKNEEFDISKNNLEKLKSIFPDCFNKNGDFDIELFKEDISKNVSVIKEGYSLNFLGKNYAKLIASLDTETILFPDENNNNQEENMNSDNIYISGDNIDALKHLIKSYSNKIKCIYIDPPYNTGSDGFVYNDKFNFSIDKLVNELDISEEEARRIYNMTNSKSNSHSSWLTFMYSRIYLARQLLKDDGVLFISIDDNEQADLKLLCDNIFGEEQCDTIIWRKSGVGRDGKMKNTTTFRKDHEYIITCFKNELLLNKIIEKPNFINEYGNPDNDPRGPYKAGSISNKESASKIEHPNYYSVTAPNGRVFTRQFDFSKDEFDRLNNDILVNDKGEKVSRIYWGKDNNSVPSVKIFINEERKITPYSILLNKGTTTDGTKEVNQLLECDMTQMRPKPSSLISTLIQLSTNTNDIVLDFFSGTGTSAEATMMLNSKYNMGLKYIMVQLQEKVDIGTEAYRNGYRTIDEIGQERIRRAAKKIKEETHANIDYGFKHYIIKDIDTNTLDKLEKFEPNYMLSDETILDKFGIPSILTTWMVSDGYGLTDKYEKLELEDYEAYKCNNTVYLINPNLSSKAIKCLIEKYENKQDFDCNRIVLFGYSFNLTEIQTLKDNLKQIKNIKDLTVDVITRY
jgi:adenine-specific DNA-methyltransferase